MRLLGRSHLVTTQQPFTDRTTRDQRVRHGKRSRGNRHSRCTRQTIGLFKIRTKCCRRPQTTHQGNGTNHDAVTSVQAQHRSQAHAQDVLHHSQNGHGNQEEHEHDAALTNDLKTGHQADRRKERQHQLFLKRRVEFHAQNTHAFKDGKRDGNTDTAHHRRRNRIATEKLNFGLEPGTEIVGQHGKSDRLDHIDFENPEAVEIGKVHFLRLRRCAYSRGAILVPKSRGGYWGFAQIAQMFYITKFHEKTVPSIPIKDTVILND